MYTAEGTLTAWRKASGAAVEAGEVVLEIETEKAVQDVEAPAGGVLHHVLAEGARLQVESLIGYILAPGEAVPGDAAGAAVPRPAPAAASAPAAPADRPARGRRRAARQPDCQASRARARDRSGVAPRIGAGRADRRGGRARRHGAHRR